MACSGIHTSSVLLHILTNSKSERMEPRREAWTTSIFFSFSAIMERMSSTAFPNEALSRAPKF